MKQVGKVFCVLVLLVFSAVANAGDVAAGKARSIICAACHGGEGISPVGVFPNLAGQKEEYLNAQITAFKEGARVSPQMAPMVSGLSADDIANLAAFIHP